jgi:hypothetical protein
MDNFFTQTSTDPYTRHYYKIHYLNGKSVIVDNYSDVISEWYQGNVAFVDVLDANEKKKNRKELKGFK